MLPDRLWNVVDAGLPTSAWARTEEKFNPDVTPVNLTSTFQFPKNNWRDELRVMWYQGGAMPKSPSGWVDLNKIGHGAIFKGSKGFLVSSFDNRMVIPFGDHADLSYYRPRPAEEVLGGGSQCRAHGGAADRAPSRCDGLLL